MTAGARRGERATEPLQGSGDIRFPGLDTLRCLAALFVVVGHVPMTQAAVGLPHPSWGAMFFRGAPAVYFFFTLSGFLISFLLLEERARVGTIDVGRFYGRRALRIWPLYLTVMTVGLAFYNALLPRLGIAHPTGYSVPLALALYLALLPNVMNSLHAMGGILNPLWSIGVEEQFYVAWAPAVRAMRDRLPVLAWTVLTLSFASFAAASYGLYGEGRAKMLAGQLRFHYMAVGALWAWAYQRDRARLLDRVWFRRPAVQAALWLLLAAHFFVGLPVGDVPTEILQMALYGWLVIEVGANPRRLLRLAHPWTEYLGRISYGTYMLHMPVVYATAFLFQRSGLSSAPIAAYLLGFYAMVLGGTWSVAALSYRWFEAPFLRLKERFSTLHDTRTATTDGHFGEVAGLPGPVS